jgi:hypothetical protein
MTDLFVSPLSFSPTKVGYKQYVKAGGAMQLASFQVFERRSEVEVLVAKGDKAYDSSVYYMEQYEMFKSEGDFVNTKVMLNAYEVRLGEYTDIVLKLKKLNYVFE